MTLDAPRPAHHTTRRTWPLHTARSRHPLSWAQVYPHLTPQVASRAPGSQCMSALSTTHADKTTTMTTTHTTLNTQWHAHVRQVASSLSVWVA